MAMTRPIEEAVALLPSMKAALAGYYPAASVDHRIAIWFTIDKWETIIAALEAMRDQKARDDAIWNEAVKAAANVLNKRWTDYDQEHGFVDYETGVVEYPGNGNEMVYEWQELEESILALTKPSEFVWLDAKALLEHVRKRELFWKDKFNAERHQRPDDYPEAIDTVLSELMIMGSAIRAMLKAME